MYQIVLCEDDPMILKQTRNVIAETVEKLGEKYSIYCYANYNESLEGIIKDQNPKIYVLDVNLVGKSGFEIAKIIREVDRKSCIILMTVREDMIGQALKERLQLLDYIIKNDLDQCKRLKESIKIAFETLKSSRKDLLFLEEKHTIFPLDFNEIIYIHREQKDRKLIIHTTKREYKITRNLTDLNTQLDNRFFLCHRSCIVNVQYIEKIDLNEESITLKNGEKIFLLARSHKKELYNRLFSIE